MTVPRCDGAGRLPCDRCNGSGRMLVGGSLHWRCIDCGGKGRSSAPCHGCPKCEARKAIKAAAKDEQPKLF